MKGRKIECAKARERVQEISLFFFFHLGETKRGRQSQKEREIQRKRERGNETESEGERLSEREGAREREMASERGSEWLGVRVRERCCILQSDQQQSPVISGRIVKAP